MGHYEKEVEFEVAEMHEDLQKGAKGLREKVKGMQEGIDYGKGKVNY